MQLCNITVRIGGSLLHTVPLTDATPAEILVLKHLHGDDAVVDIMPTRMGKTKQDSEWERLSAKYDKASSMSVLGDSSKSIMASLFPGAMRKLPITLKEIGMGHLNSPFAAQPAPVEVIDPVSEYADTEAFASRESEPVDQFDADEATLAAGLPLVSLEPMQEAA